MKALASMYVCIQRQYWKPDNYMPFFSSLLIPLCGDANSFCTIRRRGTAKYIPSNWHKLQICDLKYNTGRGWCQAGWSGANRTSEVDCRNGVYVMYTDRQTIEEGRRNVVFLLLVCLFIPIYVFSFHLQFYLFSVGFSIHFFFFFFNTLYAFPGILL